MAQCKTTLRLESAEQSASRGVTGLAHLIVRVYGRSQLPHGSDCLFCKIVAGEIPSTSVLDTDHAFAFLDINPLAAGHTLLIPKRHYTTIDEMAPDDLCSVIEPLAGLVSAVKSATGAEACNILQNNGTAAGQVVMHVHFHIIPRSPRDGLGFRWNAGKYSEHQAEQVQQDIRAAMNKTGRNK